MVFRDRLLTLELASADDFDVSQGVPALVTFVTAGFPERDDTVPILLAMQAGGADIIELSVPFSDPIADGPVIQAANTVWARTSAPVHSI